MKINICIIFNINGFYLNLVDMQLLSKFNKRIRFLLCVTDIYSKYAWVVPSKNKKGVTIVNAFQKILDDFNGIAFKKKTK